MKIEADQDLPLKLMKNKLLHRQQYKELLYIVKKNIPNITAEETIELFKKLAKTGCSAAMAANVLIDQTYTDDETFRNSFGFSLLNGTNIDSNKLMVDIFSKLYGKAKVRFIEYEHYSFNSVKEAAKKLLNQDFETDSLASVALFNNGIMSNGFDPEGKLLFKSSQPKITNYVGTCTEVAKQKFGITGVKTFDELKKICQEKNITLEYKDLEIYEKFTGLTKDNFNFWIQYYLQSYNLDFTLNNEYIHISDFKNNYEDFIKHFNDLTLSGFSITVSSGPNSEVYMHTNAPLSWGKISSERYGHVMAFKGFNKDNDIIVSSYGKDYIISKEYFDKLEYDKIVKVALEKDKDFESKIAI